MKRLLLAVPLLAITCSPAAAQTPPNSNYDEQPTSVERIQIANADTIYRLRFSNGDRCYYISSNNSRVALSCIPSYMPTSGETHNPPRQ
jgi:hypothetical protein